MSVVAACFGTASAKTATTAADDTLVVNTSFIVDNIDPARDLQPTGFIIDHAVYETLTTAHGADTTPKPGLATSWKASDGAKKFTFQLRKNAKFSDGSPVTAADVVFSLKRVTNIKGDPSFLMAGLTVSASGKYTVVVRSATANPAVPTILTTPALGIVSEKIVKAHGGTAASNADKADKAATWLNKNSAGSGPYVLTQNAANNQVTLTANPNYWGKKPKFAKVVLRNMAAPTQLLNVQRGANQIALDLSSQQALSLKGKSSIQVHTSASPNLFFLQMTMDPKVSPVFSNPKIQQAIRYGLNYAGMIQTAGAGAIQPGGIIPKQFLGGLSKVAYKTDVARAKKLVAQSGIQNPSGTFSFPSGITVNGLSFETLAQRVQSDLANIGITVKLQAVPVQEFLDNYSAGKYDIVQSYWGPDYVDPNDYLVFLPGNKVASRSTWPASANPSLVSLGKKAGTTTDAKQRKSLFESIQRRLNQSSPYIPMLQPAQAIVGTSNLTGVVLNPSWLLALAEVGTK